jgi:hypothetical protein
MSPPDGLRADGGHQSSVLMDGHTSFFSAMMVKTVERRGIGQRLEFLLVWLVQDPISLQLFSEIVSAPCLALNHDVCAKWLHIGSDELGVDRWVPFRCSIIAEVQSLPNFRKLQQQQRKSLPW